MFSKWEIKNYFSQQNTKPVDNLLQKRFCKILPIQEKKVKEKIYLRNILEAKKRNLFLLLFLELYESFKFSTCFTNEK